MPRTLALLVLLAAGCATTVQDARSARAHGTSAIYRTTEARAIEFARQIFSGAGADPVTVEGNRIEGTSLFEEPGSRWSRLAVGDVTGAWIGREGPTVGNVMVAWVEREGPDEVRVTVVTRRRTIWEFPMDLTEADFHRRFRILVHQERLRD